MSWWENASIVVEEILPLQMPIKKYLNDFSSLSNKNIINRFQINENFGFLTILEFYLDDFLSIRLLNIIFEY